MKTTRPAGPAGASVRFASRYRFSSAQPRSRASLITTRFSAVASSGQDGAAAGAGACGGAGVRATGAAARGPDTALAIRAPAHASVEVARADMGVFLLCWDEYHIAQLASATNGRAALPDFVRNALGPTDLVAVMGPLTTIDAL